MTVAAVRGLAPVELLPPAAGRLLPSTEAPAGEVALDEPGVITLTDSTRTTDVPDSSDSEHFSGDSGGAFSPESSGAGQALGGTPANEYCEESDIGWIAREGDQPLTADNLTLVIYRSYVHTQILLNKSVQIVEQRGLSGEPIDVRDSRSRGPADGSNSSGGWRQRQPHARPGTGRACSDRIGTHLCLEPRRLRRG